MPIRRLLILIYFTCFDFLRLLTTDIAFVSWLIRCCLEIYFLHIRRYILFIIGDICVQDILRYGLFRQSVMRHCRHMMPPRRRRL